MTSELSEQFSPTLMDDIIHTEFYFIIIWVHSSSTHDVCMYLGFQEPSLRFSPTHVSLFTKRSIGS